MRPVCVDRQKGTHKSKYVCSCDLLGLKELQIVAFECYLCIQGNIRPQQDNVMCTGVCVGLKEL